MERTAVQKRGTQRKTESPFVSIALDPISILIDSAAHVWQRLETYAILEQRPQRCDFDMWFSHVTTQQIDDADAQQLQRDYVRLCNLMDQLELVLHDAPHAIRTVRERFNEQLDTH